VGYASVTTLKKPRDFDLEVKGEITLNVSARANRFTEPRDIGRSDHGTSQAPTGLLPHLRWELEQVMSRVRPADLSGAEIAALLVVLAPAHCRVIGGPASRPGLPVSGTRG